MLSSKANAALARLKEIEEKYKMKRKEQRWKEVTILKKDEEDSDPLCKINLLMLKSLYLKIMVFSSCKLKLLIICDVAA